MPLNNAFQIEQIDVGSGLLLIDVVQNKLVIARKEIQDAIDNCDDSVIVMEAGEADELHHIEQVALISSEPETATATVETRKSCRSRKSPQHLSDYVLDNDVLHTKILAINGHFDNSNDNVHTDEEDNVQKQPTHDTATEATPVEVATEQLSLP